MIDNFYVKFEGAGYRPPANWKSSPPKRTPRKSKKFPGQRFSPIHHPGISQSLHWLSLCALLCNNSSLQKKENSWQILGDPTEGSLRTMSLKSTATWKPPPPPPGENPRTPLRLHPKNDVKNIPGTVNPENFSSSPKARPRTRHPIPAISASTPANRALLTKAPKKNSSPSTRIPPKSLRTLALAYRELTKLRNQRIPRTIQLHRKKRPPGKKS